MKPGASNPTKGVPKTLSTTPNTKLSAKGFRVVVATEGSIFAVYRDSPNDICELVMPAGVHHEPGEFVELWRDAATIVTNPADTIVAYGQ